MSFQPQERGPPAFTVFWNLRLSCVSLLLSRFAAVPVSSTLAFLSLPLRRVFLAFSFHCRSFRRGAPAVFGLRFARATLGWFQPGQMREMAPYMSGECVISSVLSRHNKNLKRQTRVSAQGRTSVTAPWYSSVLFRKQRKIHPWGRRACWPKRRGEKRETPGPLAPLTLFLPALGLPYVNWVIQECCLFYPRSSFPSSELPLFYFLGLFPSLPLATATLDSLFLF